MNNNRKILWLSGLLFFAVVILGATVARAQTVGMVVDYTNGNVIVFDADTDTVDGIVKANNNAQDCEILDDQSLGFVSNPSGSQVFVIDPSELALAAGTNPIPVTPTPLDLTISSDQQFVLSAMDQLTVPVIDIAARSQIGSLSMGTRIFSVEACNDNSVLATSWSGGLVYRLMIDGAGNLTNTGETGDYERVSNVACGPSGGNGVATNHFSGIKSLQSYNYSPLTSVSTSETLGDGVTVLISPDGKAAYIRTNIGMSEGSIEGFTYNEATGELGVDSFVSFPVAYTPPFFGVDQMAFHPNGSKLYVSEGPNLNVYDPAKGDLLDTITDPALVSGTGVCLPANREIEVDIDIKPKSDLNPINCNNEKEVITVAILTTDIFDATTVDHTTVTFESASEMHLDKKTGVERRHEKDVDDDGDIDLVLHFLLAETDLTCDSTEGILMGMTFDGISIKGTDSIHIVNVP